MPWNSPTDRNMRELEFVNWVLSQSAFDPSRVPVGPGDDCAVVQLGKERLLVTVDQVLDGVHFRLAEHGPFAAGRKAMARNLSDVAAMAGLPSLAVASLALPAGFSAEQARELYDGLREVGDAFDCPLVGGDTGSWSGPLVVSVTVVARPAGLEPVLRAGAKAGDAICVTGALGGAWRTRRHLEFTPRIREARWIASRHRLHAMIDVSDGLALDLWRLCQAGGVGARLEAGAVPIHPDVPDGPAEDRLAAALGDGEDYELLFALAPEEAKGLLGERAAGVPIRQIGTVTASPGLVLVRPDGTEENLQPRGWEHRT